MALEEAESGRSPTSKRVEFDFQDAREAEMELGPLVNPVDLSGDTEKEGDGGKVGQEEEEDDNTVRFQPQGPPFTLTW